MKLLLTSDTHYGMDNKTQGKLERFWKKVSEEIKEKDIKAVIWAGDLAAFRQKHFYRSLEQARKHIDIPILLVRGNHDLWDGEDLRWKVVGRRPLETLYRLHKEWFEEFDIHHLEGKPFEIDNVLICGFDGWYASANPPTNDKHWMPEYYESCPIMAYLSNRAWEKFQDCLDLDTSKYRAKVIVTHHNPYPYGKAYSKDAEPEGMSANFRFLEEIKDKFDVLCCGHTHKLKDEYEGNLRVLNSGSDYNNPKYIVFDI